MPNARQPSELQLLSNGSYHVMLTDSGGGYSRCKTAALTRWREDATCDPWGAFCYIREASAGLVWSTTLQPTGPNGGSFAAEFTAGQAAFRTTLHDIDAHTLVAVAPDDDVELRRISLANRSPRPRQLDLTSYAEIVLGDAAADAAHPAFANLFVETEIVADSQAILCKRRARGDGAADAWLFHMLVADPAAIGTVSFETDRMRFIGRGRSAAEPLALQGSGALSNTHGPVLDPVAAVRCEVALQRGATAVLDLLTGCGGSREACLALMRKYGERRLLGRLPALAATQAAAFLAALAATEADSRLFTRLAHAVLYANPAVRADANVLRQNALGQPALWAYGISGDLPIVLLQVANPAQVGNVRLLVNAQTYWRHHGLETDLVILCADDPQPNLVADVTAMVAACGSAKFIDQRGGVFVRAAARVTPPDRLLLQTAARIVLDGDQFAQQLARLQSLQPRPLAVPPPAASPPAAPETRRAAAPLRFDNGLGGFTPDGLEYVVTVARDHMTPSPWVNVIANPGFGTLVSESGSATTWSENAQLFRLTPWSNDPVGDPNTEALYLRDEATGRFWSPTLLPCGGAAPYITRHGFGYSVFEHSENEIATTLCLYVAIDAPVKFLVLRLSNESARSRRLSVTAYVEWVLGDQRAKTAMQVITAIDADSGALFARNAYNTDFTGRIGFFDTDPVAGITRSGDRREFLGDCGTLRNPAALSRPLLSGTVGEALDPCAAMRVPFELAAGETREIVFRLGAAASEAEAQRTVAAWRGPTAAAAALAAVNAHWRRTLGTLRIETADSSLNYLANGWLLYQVLGSRIWARNAFYQSSGAFGFRDQLQDMMALAHAKPEFLRAHLLLCASRQFREGDVQHWWHPPAGRGVRTRCSDDFLWLPFATCRYVTVTGDVGVLDEPAPFLDLRPLHEGEESLYDLPQRAAETASLYGHCTLAIVHGLRFGEHGLPLMGSGDWNDGMNLVGAAGRGESVWLAFFLYAVLTQFGELANRRGDAAFAKRCQDESARLRSAIEAAAWDGDWYRRGWFDDGSPLGTAGNAECRIDSLPQSWAVLSGAGDAQRSSRAMESVNQRLVRRDASLVQLLDPPFDRSNPSPGYIQGYVRGVRENGGQYTHAAVWTAMAFAALGDADRAWELVRMLDPVRHGDSAAAAAIYKSEPYVMAGDVYAFAPHAGRGGWTWYTGSAGWMYRFIVESLLGVTVESDRLRMTPCMPRDWTSFKVHYRYRETVYAITVSKAGAGEAPGWTVDGSPSAGAHITLVDDGRPHAAEWRLAPTTAAGPRPLDIAS